MAKDRRQNKIALARKLYVEKIKLEKVLANDLRKYFVQCKGLIASGKGDKLPSVKPFLVKHNEIILNTVIKPGGKKDMRANLKQRAIDNNHGKIVKHAMAIDDKTHELAKRSLFVAKQTLTDKNGITSTSAMNKTTANIFDNYSQGRIQGISTTETTSLYESARRKVFDDLKSVIVEDIQDDDIDDLEDIDDMYDSDTIDQIVENVREGADHDETIGIVSDSTHEWSAIGDDKTRETHMEADGQVKPINEPFDVGEYQLMYPGDESLGAGPEEICNCRCSEIY